MKIAFYSTMGGMPWGGSEVLWSGAAEALLAEGHQVDVCFRKWPTLAEPLARLQEAGARLSLRGKKKIGRKLRRLLEKTSWSSAICGFHGKSWLTYAQPDFVLISAGYHIDDISVGDICRERGIPYGILVQSAGHHDWIHAGEYETVRRIYSHAERLFFVSDQNRQTMEMNLGLDLSHAEIVDNPFNLPEGSKASWAEPVNQRGEETWRLACVGRLHFASKAQDVLLQVLRQEKWRRRPLEVVCWGSDNGSLGPMQDLIEQFGLQEKIRYGGFASDIKQLWSDHHGLILPSRFEGNPLALIEAMMCGRVPIVTNIGRVDELVDDNLTGFIAGAATADLVDEALERAWQRRTSWESMGKLAAETIRQRHGMDPTGDFARRLLEKPASSAPQRAAA